MLLMKQGEQAWLLTSDGGNHEFARCFWLAKSEEETPRYRVGAGGNARLGPHTLEHVEIDARGARLSWEGGRKSWIPADWFQLTYR